jgi:hypothetical protein
MLFQDGTLMETLVGSQSRGNLEALIKKYS